jgi:hypothetical protein
MNPVTSPNTVSTKYLALLRTLYRDEGIDKSQTHLPVKVGDREAITGLKGLFCKYKSVHKRHKGLEARTD